MGEGKQLKANNSSRLFLQKRSLLHSIFFLFFFLFDLLLQLLQDYAYSNLFFSHQNY